MFKACGALLEISSLTFCLRKNSASGENQQKCGKAFTLDRPNFSPKMLCYIPVLKCRDSPVTQTALAPAESKINLISNKNVLLQRSIKITLLRRTKLEFLANEPSHKHSFLLFSGQA